MKIGTNPYFDCIAEKMVENILGQYKVYENIYGDRFLLMSPRTINTTHMFVYNSRKVISEAVNIDASFNMEGYFKVRTSFGYAYYKMDESLHNDAVCMMNYANFIVYNMGLANDFFINLVSDIHPYLTKNNKVAIQINACTKLQYPTKVLNRNFSDWMKKNKLSNIYGSFKYMGDCHHITINISDRCLPEARKKNIKQTSLNLHYIGASNGFCSYFVDGFDNAFISCDKNSMTEMIHQFKLFNNVFESGKRYYIPAIENALLRIFIRDNNVYAIPFHYIYSTSSMAMHGLDAMHEYYRYSKSICEAIKKKPLLSEICSKNIANIMPSFKFNKDGRGIVTVRIPIIWNTFPVKAKDLIKALEEEMEEVNKDARKNERYKKLFIFDSIINGRNEIFIRFMEE